MPPTPSHTRTSAFSPAARAAAASSCGSIVSPAISAARCGETAGPNDSGVTSDGFCLIVATPREQLVIARPLIRLLVGAGHDRLEGGDLLALLRQRGADRGRQHRLAYAGVGGRDEDPAHAAGGYPAGYAASASPSNTRARAGSGASGRGARSGATVRTARASTPAAQRSSE